MKNSTFNFSVAMFCAGCAAFGNPAMWAVMMNVIFALINLWVGLSMYKEGQ